MDKENETIPDDVMRTHIVEHLLIRDAETGEVLVNQRSTNPQEKDEG